jgi:hypothetical protein
MVNKNKFYMVIAFLVGIMLGGISVNPTPSEKPKERIVEVEKIIEVEAECPADNTKQYEELIATYEEILVLAKEGFDISAEGIMAVANSDYSEMERLTVKMENLTKRIEAKRAEIDSMRIGL